MKHISANVEILKAKNTKVKVFGLTATEAQLVLTIMATVKSKIEQDYGLTFRAPSKPSAAISGMITSMTPRPSSRC